MILMIFVAAATTAALVIALLRPYTRSGDPGGFLTFTPAGLGGVTWRGLIFSSGGGVYLELLLVCWISSEIRIFAYFKNFVLIACFFGVGIGCFLLRRALCLAARVV